jgi:hypothetical protein
LWSTARQLLLTRQLFAASVAPQRNRLAQLIPPEWSQSLAAAGRHGASSARSIAFAAVAERATKTHAEINSFMLNGPSLIFALVTLYLPFCDGKYQRFGATHKL